MVQLSWVPASSSRAHVVAGSEDICFYSQEAGPGIRRYGVPWRAPAQTAGSLPLVPWPAQLGRLSPASSDTHPQSKISLGHAAGADLSWRAGPFLWQRGRWDMVGVICG